MAKILAITRLPYRIHVRRHNGSQSGPFIRNKLINLDIPVQRNPLIFWDAPPLELLTITRLAYIIAVMRRKWVARGL